MRLSTALVAWPLGFTTAFTAGRTATAPGNRLFGGAIAKARSMLSTICSYIQDVFAHVPKNR